LHSNTLEVLTFILFILKPCHTISEQVSTEISGDGDTNAHSIFLTEIQSQGTRRVTVAGQTPAVRILLVPCLIKLRAQRFLSAVLEENTSEVTDESRGIFLSSPAVS